MIKFPPEIGKKRLFPCFSARFCCFLSVEGSLGGAFRVCIGVSDVQDEASAVDILFRFFR
jgi:hypothetical protein